MKVWEFLLEQLKNNGISFLFFIGGAVLGAVMVYYAYRLIAFGKKKGKEGVWQMDVSDEKSDCLNIYQNADTDLDFKQKLNVFLENTCMQADKICGKYTDKKYSKYKIVKAHGFIDKDVEFPLEFTAYELLYFADLTLTVLQNELEGVLTSPVFTKFYGAYRIINKEIDKNPSNVKLSYIFALFFAEKPQTEETKFKRVIKGAIKKVTAPALKIGFKIIKPSVKNLVDGFFIAVQDGLTDNFNLLFSHNLTNKKDGVQYLAVKDDGGKMSV